MSHWKTEYLSKIKGLRSTYIRLTEGQGRYGKVFS